MESDLKFSIDKFVNYLLLRTSKTVSEGIQESIGFATFQRLFSKFAALFLALVIVMYRTIYTLQVNASVWKMLMPPDVVVGSS